jgi:hypothetical protein
MKDDARIVYVGSCVTSIPKAVRVLWGGIARTRFTQRHLSRHCACSCVCSHTSIIGPKVEEIDKDNSLLCDENETNQGLTQEEIEAMKAEGKVMNLWVPWLLQSPPFIVSSLLVGLNILA